jgi:SSS family solute:Na+ symporter
MNLVLIGTVLVLYLAVTAFLGYLGFRQTKNAADYLVAGRKAHPLVMAISYGATFISTSAIVGFGGAAAVYGMGLLWLTFLNIFVGIFIAFVLFGKRTRKLGHALDAHTFPEILAKRYNSPFLQGASGILIFVAMPLYAGSVIIGGAQFIAQSFVISYEVALIFFVSIVALYVLMGGLKGVMYTDTFQGAIMFVGMAILLIATYMSFGGIVKAHQALGAIADKVPEKMTALGHRGWTAMPSFLSVYWWQLVSTIVLGVGIGVLAQPQLVVRFMTVRSDRELNRAVLGGGVFIFMMTGVAFVVGALSNAWFFGNPGFNAISITAAKGKVDNIIPLYITNAMPAWFSAVFLITLLSAAMSTLSSQFHTLGTAFGRDFLEKGIKVHAKNSTATTRLAMIAGILVSAFLAWALPTFFETGSAIVATGTAIFFGICAAAFLPSYFSALYWKRATRAGAVVSFIGGIATSSFWLAFMHAKEAVPLGFCKAIFGIPTLSGKGMLSQVDPIVVALPVSAILMVVVSLATKRTDEETKTLFGN